jgi:branched-chain amino acid transport system permease protein
MQEFIQQALNAVVVGSVYCLIASGLTLVYGVMHIPNFAQGNIYMAAAYAVFFLKVIYGLNYWLMCLVVVILFITFGVVIEKFCFRPVRDAPHINSFVVAIGLLMTIEGFIVLVFSADYKEILPPFAGIIDFHGVAITIQRILVIVGTFIIMISLQLFLKKTTWGMCLEAMSQNRELAMAIGIKVNRTSMVAFMISSGLAGIAGILMAPVSFVYPAMGMGPLLVAFAAIIFGGMGSLPGAVIGSFIMAFAQVFSTQYIAAMVSDIAIFGVMILILLFRPVGIMGRKH